MYKEQVQRMFDVVDTMSAGGFVEFLAPDVRFRFGSAPEAEGRAAVHAAVAGFFSSINGLRHRLLGYWEQGSAVIVKLEVEYTRKDGRKVDLPCANIFEFEGKLIRDYRIYMDIGPVYA
jgi:ketosteroid isomerase-like protein